MSEQTTTGNFATAELPPVKRRTRPSLVKLAKLTALMAFLLAILLGTGLATYTGYVLLATEKEAQAADAIVVVTGGAGRLEKALMLLKHGKGKRLLISGVYPGYSLTTLQRRYSLSSSQLACCVDLDSQALNTVANATQTAQWARERGFESLIIVTSAYHMPRTMLEMRRAAPEIAFQGQIVTRKDRTFFTRLFDWNNVLLLTKEYGKLLGAVLHGSSARLETQ